MRVLVPAYGWRGYVESTGGHGGEARVWGQPDLGELLGGVAPAEEGDGTGVRATGGRR